MLAAIQQPATCLHFLRPGRLVRIREGALDWGWGIVVSVMRKTVAVNAAVQADDLGPASAYILDLLLSCDAASVKGALLSLPTLLCCPVKPYILDLLLSWLPLSKVQCGLGIDYAGQLH